MTKKDLIKKYIEMSPFEFKNVLINLAEKTAKQKKKPFLNAGRGNPNFLNTRVREAFSYLNLFASKTASKRTPIPDLGLKTEKKGIANKLKKYLSARKGPATTFLKKAVTYAEKTLKIKPDDFVYEMVDASLGDFYPDPPRIFPHMEKVINEYLRHILCADIKPARGQFELFATEGATAAMVYVFDSLKENKILKYGDHIALITPIFSPYLEIPALNDYRLVEVDVKGSEELGWQIPDSELKKLENKKVKALFMVHPTNPTSIKLHKETLKKIQRLVKTKRKDLIVLTDTVYATFVDKFNSLVEVIPKNTICVYSYSKFYGVTGWRLGVIMLHKDNVVDKLISKLPKGEQERLDKRYRMTSPTPGRIKFIDRLEIDSRDVALAHTGGLSCPQQCIMTLFTLFYLLDKQKKYKKSIQGILRKRVGFLYKNLKIPLPKGPEHTYYYALIDIGKMAEHKYGDKFAEHLMKKYCIEEFLLKLSKDTATVCLPGDGFAGPKWSLRVSLANLETEDYIYVGKNISKVMQDYYEEFKNKKH